MHRPTRSLASCPFAAGLAVSLAAASLAENLVTNGSFEDSSPGNPSCGYFCPGSCSIAGWQAGPVDFFPCDPGMNCPDGNHVVELNQCWEGWIHQSVRLVAGTSYRLRFQHGTPRAHCSNSPLVKESRVTVGGFSWDFSTVPDPELPELEYRWYAFEVAFTATSGPSTLRFESLNPGCSGAWIDGITLVEVPPCPGDLDASGMTDADDIALLFGNWGPSTPKSAALDLDADGLVGANDLAIVLAGWGNCP